MADLTSEVPLKDAESAALNRQRIMSWRLESSAPGHSLHSGAAGTLSWAGDGVFPEAKRFSSPILSPLSRYVLFQKHQTHSQFFNFSTKTTL